MSSRPTIAATMGDPAGIGPEVVLKAMTADAVREVARLAVFGHDEGLRRAADRLGIEVSWHRVGGPAELASAGDGPLVCDLGGAPLDQLFGARATAEGGAACLRYITAAADAARDGLVDAMATAPIHKQAIAMAGCPHRGHTDLLAGRLGVRDVVMMLVGGPLRVALVTMHIALAEVPEALSTEAIVATGRITAAALRRWFGVAEPCLAVCGLNPHASDGSRFGTEELRLIEPAIVELRSAGVEARGPLPPDTCFVRAARGEFDAVVAMYHDQGLIPLKLLAFDDAVNVTLGLPIIRTSVDHGTAYDIAGQGVASPNSMIAAIRLAAHMAGVRERPGQ